MKSAGLFPLVVLLVAASPAVSQAPLPTALQEGKRVFITGEGVERKRIDHLAKEVEKRGRFEVVADREQADLVFVLTRGRPGPTVMVPIGGVVVGVQEGTFRLMIYQPGESVALWDDSRDGDGNGTITGLVKQLLERLQPKS